MRECPVYTGQFGKLLQKSLRSIVLDEASCARIIPPIFNILYSLTMPTAGLGLRVDVPNSAMLLDARQLLCSGVRQLAEQAPEAFLPHIGGFKKLVEQGQDINKITIRELNIFMEGLWCLKKFCWWNKEWNEPHWVIALCFTTGRVSHCLVAEINCPLWRDGRIMVWLEITRN